MQIIEKEFEVSDPQDYFIQSLKPRSLYLAGAGSGKSHTAGIISSEYIVNFPHIRGFIGANTYGQLTKSTLDRIFKVWGEHYGYIQGVHYVVDKIPPKNFKIFGARLKSYENTISFSNGCLIFVASLDNYKVIDGTEFGWAILDETKDTKEEAVKEVITFRLRQPGMYIDSQGELVGKQPEGEYTGYNPLYILTSPAKVDWINDWFGLTDQYEAISKKIFSKTDFFTFENRDCCVVISSTFHNAHNLPKGWIEAKIREHQGNPNLIEMLVYGSPIAKSGGEFAHQFNRLNHVKRVRFNPALPIHFTLDINFSPYLAGLAAQIERDDLTKTLYIRFVKEFAIPPPNNSTKDMCIALEAYMLQVYGGLSNFRGLFYYGDYSGKNNQNITKEYKHHFDVINQELRRYLNNHSDKVTRKNPSVTKSRDFLNGLFAGAYNVVLEIDESCKHFIHDLEFAKADQNGSMIKPKAKDPITGLPYEKLGHHLDGGRYFLCEALDYLFYKD